MEYPAILNTNINKTNLGKLQVVQNKALRFMKGITLKDKARSKDLHKEFNIDPVNIRLDRLACKFLNTMKDMYHIPKRLNRNTKYKYSDFIIEGEPVRTRRRSLADSIEKHILNKRNHNNPIRMEKLLSDWTPPHPIYNGKGNPNID